MAQESADTDALYLRRTYHWTSHGRFNNCLPVFQRLVEAGHSLIIVEHNLDIIKSADYIIDLGPEGVCEADMLLDAVHPNK